jgi:hypothetical protein
LHKSFRFRARGVREEKLLDVRVGLLFNFHEIKLVDGIKRLVLIRANKI